MGARRAILALPAAGSLFLTGVLVRGPFAAPALGAAAFAERATAPFYGLAYVLITAAAVLSIFGYLALRQALPGRLTTVATALGIAGMVFLTPLFGVSGVAFPALGRALAAGDAAALATAADAFASPAVMVFGALALLGWVAHILFAVAVWRAGTIPRVTVAPLAASTLMMCVPTVYPVEIAGCALFLVAGALIAWSLLRR